MLEPYAMKVARTVPRGGSFSNKMTYLTRPYAALLLLVKQVYWQQFLVYKVIDCIEMEYLYLLTISGFCG
jgi:hypothetical protein